MTTKDDTPSSDRIVGDTLCLCDLVRSCYATQDGARWIQDTVRGRRCFPLYSPDRLFRQRLFRPWTVP